MEYNNQSHITSLKEVVYFFEHLLNERKVSYHPDDDFAEYVRTSTGEPTFTAQEVDVYNRLMEESFDVCDNEGIDIYSIGLASMRRLIDPSEDDPIDEGELVRVNGDSTIYRVVSLSNNQSYQLKAIEGANTLLSSVDNIMAI